MQLQQLIKTQRSVENEKQKYLYASLLLLLLLLDVATNNKWDVNKNTFYLFVHSLLSLIPFCQPLSPSHHHSNRTVHPCKEYKCVSTEVCIHPSLICDGINHCGDASDESINMLCQSKCKKAENSEFFLQKE